MLKIEHLGTHGGSRLGAHRGVRHLSPMQREVKRRGSWSCPSQGALCLSPESLSSQLACLSEQGRLSLSPAEELLRWGVQRGAHLLVPAPTGGGPESAPDPLRGGGAERKQAVSAQPWCLRPDAGARRPPGLWRLCTSSVGSSWVPCPFSES